MQITSTALIDTLDVMTGRYTVGPQRVCIVQKSLEFDLPVTEHVRIRGSSRAIFSKKMLKNVVPVLRRKIGGQQLYAEAVTN